MTDFLEAVPWWSLPIIALVGAWAYSWALARSASRPAPKPPQHSGFSRDFTYKEHRDAIERRILTAFQVPFPELLEPPRLPISPRRRTPPWKEAVAEPWLDEPPTTESPTTAGH